MICVLFFISNNRNSWNASGPWAYGSLCEEEIQFQAYQERLVTIRDFLLQQTFTEQKIFILFSFFYSS